MSRRKYSDVQKAEIYGLREKSSRSYFYVGSSRVGHKIRLASHLSGSRTGKAVNKHLSRKIRQVGAGNVTCEVLEYVDMAERFKREYFWISKLRDEGHRLTNIKLSECESAPLEPYTENLKNPINVSAWLDAVEDGPGVAADLRYQPLVEQLHRVGLLYLKQAEKRWTETVNAFWAHLPASLVESFRRRIQALPLPL